MLGRSLVWKKNPPQTWYILPYIYRNNHTERHSTDLTVALAL